MEISTDRPLLSSNQTTNGINLSVQQLFNAIKQAILKATGPTLLTYNNIDFRTGSQLIELLENSGEIEDVVPRLGYNSFTQTLEVNMMPTFTHDCHHKWLVKEFFRMHSSGFLSAAEFERLDLSNTSTFKSFQGPYASSVKEPDTYFEVEEQQLPSIVVESGWSEGKEQLRRDMKLWLIGGAGQVRLVLLPKWSKNGEGKVSGTIEMWSLDNAGNEMLLQTAIVFPVPTANQVLQITRQQIFGQTAPEGDPGDTFDLSIDALRRKAANSMRRDGSEPA